MLLPALALALAVHAPVAGASTAQTTIIQDDGDLYGSLAGAESTMQQMRALGASTVRVSVTWADIALHVSKEPKDASNPAAYPAAGWLRYDDIAKAAQAEGLKLDFDIEYPAPNYAVGKNAPLSSPPGVWKINTADFGAFVRALGTRYDGKYDGLPKVSIWSVWNEPNYGQSLAPATAGSSIQLSAAEYRGLLNQAWGGLRATGHGHDTILFGEIAPHGFTSGGDFNVVAPLEWLRGLYCVNSRYAELRGSLAKRNGCPTTKAASRRFRSQNPALFSASGFAAHLYAQGTAPDSTLHQSGVDTADSADLGRVGTLERTLDRLNRVYGSHKRFSIWNTEYGFQTSPPEPAGPKVVSTATAALYVNWAQYISYKNPRIASYDQYLLQDPPSYAGLFDSGLEFNDGSHKPDYAAFQVPVFMPKTTVSKPSTLQVWGGAPVSTFGGPKLALIQFQPSGSPTIETVKTPGLNRAGYFDTEIKFNNSGTLRVVWTGAGNLISRSVQVTVK